ncbi:MAG: hypothetical protein ACYS8K_03360 [Planctomycetota bacterium]|jgi:hypothetical protein
MSEERVHGESEQAALRDIPKWARRYTQNRTLPVLVYLGIFVLGSAAFGALGILIGWAAHRGRRALAIAAGLALGGLAVWWLWFCFAGVSRIVSGVSRRLYGREGEASLAGQPDATGLKVRPLPVLLFVGCVAASVILGVLGALPEESMQPVSALYVVPFMLYLGLTQKGSGSPFMLLWPLLYGIHAILLVAGAPIYFGGPYVGLNMLIPVAGYGLLSALLGHVYSRFALRRLRRLAAVPERSANGEVPDDA